MVSFSSKSFHVKNLINHGYKGNSISLLWSFSLLLHLTQTRWCQFREYLQNIAMLFFKTEIYTSGCMKEKCKVRNIAHEVLWTL